MEPMVSKIQGKSTQAVLKQGYCSYRTTVVWD